MIQALFSYNFVLHIAYEHHLDKAMILNFFLCTIVEFFVLIFVYQLFKRFDRQIVHKKIIIISAFVFIFSTFGIGLIHPNTYLKIIQSLLFSLSFIIFITSLITYCSKYDNCDQLARKITRLLGKI